MELRIGPKKGAKKNLRIAGNVAQRIGPAKRKKRRSGK
jgi:hypothetical protein